MKKFMLFLCLILLSFGFVGVNAQSEVETEVYLFYSKTCPHCKKEEEFFSKLEKEIPEKFNLNTYEVTSNRENSKLLEKVADRLDVDGNGVPYLVIGEDVIVGYYNDDVTGNEIREKINKCFETECRDVVGAVLKNSDSSSKDKETDSDKLFNVPLLGEINAKSVSLPLLTIAVGFMDGFNPCAMWILLYLLSLLINVQDTKKRWGLGLAFIIASGAMYFLFLAAWLSVFKFLGVIRIIQVIVGVVALVSGVVNIKNFYDKHRGCKVVNKEKKKRIFGNIQDIVLKKSFPLALVSIVVLAISVNLIELVCSAGLPAIYTQVLSLAELNTFSYYLYLLLYITVFMLDDIAVFAVAMFTMKLVGVDNKYAKFSSLVGGTIIFLLGVLLIIKPSLLTFS